PMKIRSLLAGAAMAALSVGSAQAQGADPKHRSFLYFLPIASVAPTVTQPLDFCPTLASEKPPIITVIKVSREIPKRRSKTCSSRMATAS
ncbi:MAG: hypothetical protein JWQ11_2659, partial [Rhizobacter sp.]|nr:hypothetical protein [Rhizobacter sp.]